MQLTKDFADHDFMCPCCGKLPNSLSFKAFLAKIQDAKNIARIPFVISNGFRCSEYNKLLGNTEDKNHFCRKSIDIQAKTPFERFSIIVALLKVGFTCFSIGESYVHVDMDTKEQRNSIWLI